MVATTALGPDEGSTANHKKWQAEKVSTEHARIAVSLALSFALIGLHTYCIFFLPIRNFASNFADSTSSVPVPSDPSPVSGTKALPSDPTSSDSAVSDAPNILLPTSTPIEAPNGSSSTSTLIEASEQSSSSADSGVTSSVSPPPTNPPTDPPTEPPTKPTSEPPTDPPTKPLTEPPHSDPPPTLWTRIPGSLLDSPDKIRLFRERFECIGRQGKWSRYVSPRLLPWPDEMSECDVGHLKKSSRHVALQDADRMWSEMSPPPHSHPKPPDKPSQLPPNPSSPPPAVSSPRNCRRAKACSPSFFCQVFSP
ncbi:unnamed protein product [Closterium sp. NIES-54]